MPVLLETTEVRWFHLGEIPSSIQDWFSEQGGVQRQPPRIDLYHHGVGPRWGIKLREGRLEIKIRRRLHGGFSLANGVLGDVESWTKWGFQFSFKPRTWVPVQKERQILFFQVAESGELLPSMPGVIPDQGGGVELTQVWLDGDPWWTVGIEVFGRRKDQVGMLKLLAWRVFSPKGAPQLALEASSGYSAWLEKFRRDRGDKN